MEPKQPGSSAARHIPAMWTKLLGGPDRVAGHDQVRPEGRAGCDAAGLSGAQRAMRAISISAFRMRASLARRSSLARKNAERSSGTGQNFDCRPRSDVKCSGRPTPQAGSNTRPLAVRQSANSAHSPALTPHIILKTQSRIDLNTEKSCSIRLGIATELAAEASGDRTHLPLTGAMVRQASNRARGSPGPLQRASSRRATDSMLRGE